MTQKSRKNKQEKDSKCRVKELFNQRIYWFAGLGAIALAFVIIGVYTSFLIGNQFDVPFDDVLKNANQNELVYRHPLTGVLQESESELPQVFGVMIDNHYNARPQSGINEAFLVIEAPVEAGISRMLAFFHSAQKVDKIGPVRSARPYFIDWNNGLSALYAHVGGSNDALDKIVSGGTYNMDEYGNQYSFWRQINRSAPHNTYTSTELLNEFNGKYKDVNSRSENVYGIWKFKDAVDSVSGESVGVDINFLPPYYTVQWVFDKDERRYYRKQHNKIDIVDGSKILADNIVVVVTDIDIIDYVGRKSVKTIGEGDAFLFQDGQRKEVKWVKPSMSKRLRFYDGDNEVYMNSGVTWVEIVSSYDDFTSK